MARKNAYQRAVDAFHAESRKQCTLLFGAASLALYRHWDMKKLAIVRIIRVAKEAWNECAADHDHSMIQMCETETGIEIQNGDGKGWRDLHYLNGTIPRYMTTAQILYMRQQQLKWIRPQVMACMLIALHRRYGFGFDRCNRIYQQIQEIEEEYHSDPDKLREACYGLTGIDVARTTTTDRRDTA